MPDGDGSLLAGYDFVDFGCSSGGSMILACKELGGHRGLGLDINPQKVQASRDAGLEAKVADVTRLDPAEAGTTRFAVLSHFLEHLPNEALALRCIDAAVRVADEFVLIRQPWFDADDALAREGLKVYWSDWTGHRTHMTVADLRAPFDRLLAEGRIGGFVVFARTPVLGSGDKAVHPLGSPPDQHGWDARRHGPKPRIDFDFPVYREVGALVRTRADRLRDGAHEFLANCVTLHEGGSLDATARG